MRKLSIIYLLGFSLFFIFLKAKAEEIFTPPEAESFVVLTWKDCVREAKKSHPELIAQEETIQATRAKKAINASAYFPQISSNLGRLRSKTTASGTTDRYSYGVSGEQLLFDGFKTKSLVRQAKAELEFEESVYQEVSRDVRFRLRKAFIELLIAQEFVRLADEITARRKQNLELLKLRYEAGREHKGSLLRAEAVFAQSSFEIEQAKRSLRVAQRRLLKELGRKNFEPIRVEEDFKFQITSEDASSIDTIPSMHPTFHRLETTIKAQEAEVASKYASFSPKISATADYGVLASRWPPNKEEWTAGVNLSLPIFEGGKRFAEISQAKAKLDKAEAEKEKGENEIILDIEETTAKWIDAANWVDVQRKFLEADTERAKIAQAQYSAGLISFEDWNIIEDNLVLAKKTFLDAKQNAAVAEANWLRAQGKGLAD